MISIKYNYNCFNMLQPFYSTMTYWLINSIAECNRLTRCLLCGLENMSQSGQWIEVIDDQRDQSAAGDH